MSPGRIQIPTSPSWHRATTRGWWNGCWRAPSLRLAERGIARDRLTIALVPGAWELPLACRRLAEAGGHQAVIALGCVIRGDTPHFDYVCTEASRGVIQAALDTGVPVAFGLLTTENEQQALDRAGGSHGNKGAEAADAALDMAGLMRALPRRRSG